MAKKRQQHGQLQLDLGLAVW